jgi:predicted amidophosphoribosyltransferase
MRGLRAATARIDGEPEQALLCPACLEGTYAFDRARSFAFYKEAVVRAILLPKFEQIEPLRPWFAEGLAEVVNVEGAKLAADVAVPVPLHRQREGERGIWTRPSAHQERRFMRQPQLFCQRFGNQRR